MSFIRRILSRAAVAGIVPVIAAAQPLGKVVVTPYVGAYAPNTTVASRNEVSGTTAIAASVEHRNAVALGATASYWFAPRFSFEIEGLYAFSDVTTKFATREPGVTTESSIGRKNAGMILGAAKLMIGLFPQTSEFQLRLGVGPAIITRVGSAYRANAEGQLTGRTDFGGAISLCTKVPVGSGVALRLRVEDFMYQARLGWKDKLDPSESYSFDKRFQSDFVLSAGLQIGVMR
jgi:hypothetical protein